MDIQNEKCVMVIDEALPRGILANTAGWAAYRESLWNISTSPSAAQRKR